MQYLTHPALRLALAPVCLVQGLAVRRRVIQLPEAVGPRRGRSGEGPVLRLLILGDSSAAGVGVLHQDDALSGRLAAELDGFDLRWRLEARSGATTASTLSTLRALPPEPYDASVVALGVNDILRQVSLKRWLAAQADLWEMLRDRFGLRHGYLSGVPPLGRFPLLSHPLRAVLGARATQFDTALAALVASRPGLRYMPFEDALLAPEHIATDGFHPDLHCIARGPQGLPH